jgi:single-stranded DNA-binding protein
VRLHSRSSTGQDGVGRYALEIIADEIQFLTPKPYRAPEAVSLGSGEGSGSLPRELSYSRAATTSRGVRHLCRPAEPRRC